MPNNISIQKQIDSVEREIRYRQRVYPRLVMDQKMSVEKAKDEIDAMRAVLETLREIEKKEGLFR